MLANSADPDEMPHFVAFHLGCHRVLISAYFMAFYSSIFSIKADLYLNRVFPVRTGYQS